MGIKIPFMSRQAWRRSSSAFFQRSAIGEARAEEIRWKKAG
jgi:hypothetical protein